MRHGCEKNKVINVDLINENESSSSEDDDAAELLTEDLEKGFFKVLGHLKKKDPKIYQENVKFYSVEKQNIKKKRLDENCKKWLRGDNTKVEDSELKKDLGALHDVWTDPSLSKTDQFLRDYILKEKFLESDESFNVEKELDQLSEEEKELQEQLLFEEKYNCRFEKPDKEFLKKYPNSVGKFAEKKRKSDSDSQLKVKKIKKENVKIDREVESIKSKHNKKTKKKLKQFIQNEVQQTGTKINIKSEPGENEMQWGNGEAITTINIKSEPGENEMQWRNGEAITTINIKSEPGENEMQWRNGEAITTINMKSEPGENKTQRKTGDGMNQKNESIKHPHTLEGKPRKKKRKLLWPSQIKVENLKEEVESDRSESKTNKQNGKSTSEKLFIPALKVVKCIKEEEKEIKPIINKLYRPRNREPTGGSGEALNQENVVNKLFLTNQQFLVKASKNKRKHRHRALKRKRPMESKAETDKNGHPIQHAEQREKMENKRKDGSRALKRKRLKESKAETDKNGHPIQYAEQREKMAKKEEPQVKDGPKKENNSEALIKNNINLPRTKIKKEKKRKRKRCYSTKHEELVNKNLLQLIKKEGFSLEKMIPRKKMRHRVLKVIFPHMFNKNSKDQRKPLQENGVKKNKAKLQKVQKTKKMCDV